ncbi:hypothetical protein HYH02_006094 [Chlamydomonas schloesseri]|uniref:Uncharacterized protein n=1 Tax=Chlamydomonas schloesseri TaxID=2026947 RepID=A0A835WL09_9CHLO|nr:hypothetical protein HYH02_006094 [Chlamydomonas schloesseri]|eukprot:KAG2448740.1 hypothetical protein HYH02_006094 [Chlamydomonas schloesseri]
MQALCNDATLSPPVFSALCSTWRLASSLCSDDPDVVASASGLCNSIRAAYMDDAQYKSCLQPYAGIRSTSGIRAGHLRACEDMAGEPMGGCDACSSSDACPNPLVSYADGCIDMDMGQCANWRTFCNSDASPTGAGAAVLCRRANNWGGIVAPPLPPSPPPPGLSPSPSASPSPSPAASPSPSMHGNMPASGPAPPAAPCVADGALPECANFSYPHTSVLADIANLCAAMDYMPGCGIWHACDAGLVSGDYCRPFTLLATICVDMPGMAGCRSYRGLCKTGSRVPQCSLRPAIPKTPSTKESQALIDTVCSANPAPVLCESCNQIECTDYISAVTDACTSAPETEGCSQLYQGWCAAAVAWEGRGNTLAPDAIANSSLAYFCEPSAAYAALPSPAPSPVPAPVPSPATTPSPGGSSPAPAPAADACVADPTRLECTTFVYPAASVAADITSLCRMMPYMPGCIIRDACTAGLVSGDYCRPFTLLATICVDMPGMAGCRSYKPMCLVPGSRVPQCSQFPAIPKTPSTRQAQGLMDAVCAAPVGAALPECAACTATSCPDPLTPLARVCANATVAADAAGADCTPYFQDWCAAASAWQAAARGSLSHFCRDSKAYAALGSSPKPAPKPAPKPSPSRSPSPSRTTRSPPPRRAAPPSRRVKIGRRQKGAALP